MNTPAKNPVNPVTYRTVLFHPDASAAGWSIPIAVIVETKHGPLVGTASFIPDAGALGCRARQTLLRCGLELLASQIERSDELPGAMGPHFALSDAVVSPLAAGAEDPVQWLVDHMLPTIPKPAGLPPADAGADALLGQARDGHTWFGVYLAEYPEEGVMGPYTDRAEAEAAGRERLGDPVMVVALTDEQAEELSRQEHSEQELALWCVDTGNEDSESRYFLPVPDRRIAEEALEGIRKVRGSSDDARVRRCRRIRLSELQVESFAHAVAESIRELASQFIVDGYGGFPTDAWAIWDDELALVDEKALARAMPAFLKVKAFVCEGNEAQEGGVA